MQPEPSLALLLLRGSRWFDRALLERLAADGWSLTAAQSLVFAHLDDAGTRPAELARRLGTTRQSTSELVAGLCALGVLEVVDDPTQARGRLVRLTGDGRRLTRRAAAHLAALEDQLTRRLGAARVRALREALSEPWE